MNKALYTFDLTGSAFIGPVTVRGSWTRLYENGSFDVDQLDIVRGQIGGNVLSGWGGRAELHLLGGVAGLRGPSWTPALDVEIDGRLYPLRPFSIRASIGSSFFEHGDPLWRAQVAPGVTIGRVDFGVSVSWLHQTGVFDATSPGAWLAMRL